MRARGLLHVRAHALLTRADAPIPDWHPQCATAPRRRQRLQLHQWRKPQRTLTDPSDPCARDTNVRREDAHTELSNNGLRVCGPSLTVCGMRELLFDRSAFRVTVVVHYRTERLLASVNRYNQHVASSVQRHTNEAMGGESHLTCMMKRSGGGRKRSRRRSNSGARFARGTLSTSGSTSAYGSFPGRRRAGGAAAPDSAASPPQHSTVSEPAPRSLRHPYRVAAGVRPLSTAESKTL